MFLQMNFYWHFSLFDVYQLYENIYWKKLSMVNLIMHNSKKLKIDGQYLCKIVNDCCILCLQEIHHHYKG
jgi:hypothetical protein